MRSRRDRPLPEISIASAKSKIKERKIHKILTQILCPHPLPENELIDLKIEHLSPVKTYQILKPQGKKNIKVNFRSLWFGTKNRKIIDML